MNCTGCKHATIFCQHKMLRVFLGLKSAVCAKRCSTKMAPQQNGVVKWHKMVLQALMPESWCQQVPTGTNNFECFGLCVNFLHTLEFLQKSEIRLPRHTMMTVCWSNSQQ